MTRTELMSEQNIGDLMTQGEAQILLRLGILKQIRMQSTGDVRLSNNGGVNDQIETLELALQRLRSRPAPAVVGLTTLSMHARKG